MSPYAPCDLCLLHSVCHRVGALESAALDSAHIEEPYPLLIGVKVLCFPGRGLVGCRSLVVREVLLCTALRTMCLVRYQVGIVPKELPVLQMLPPAMPVPLDAVLHWQKLLPLLLHT